MANLKASQGRSREQTLKEIVRFANDEIRKIGGDLDNRVDLVCGHINSAHTHESNLADFANVIEDHNLKNSLEMCQDLSLSQEQWNEKCCAAELQSAESWGACQQRIAAVCAKLAEFKFKPAVRTETEPALKTESSFVEGDSKTLDFSEVLSIDMNSTIKSQRKTSLGRPSSPCGMNRLEKPSSPCCSRQIFSDNIDARHVSKENTSKVVQKVIKGVEDRVSLGRPGSPFTRKTSVNSELCRAIGTELTNVSNLCQ